MKSYKNVYYLYFIIIIFITNFFFVQTVQDEKGFRTEEYPNPYLYEYVWNSKNDVQSVSTYSYIGCVPYVNLITCNRIQTERFLFSYFFYSYYIVY
jgi:hypothetical protein